ncbi:MAG: alkaline phosphatase family protein, partial [Actinomycetota bacterium]
MLTVLQFDCISSAVMARMLSDGRLTSLAGLRDRGVWHDLDAPATAFAAGVQHTLHSGLPLEDHGLFYPFQWSASEQRGYYMDAFPAPTPIWERLGHEQGWSTLSIDPYESRRPAHAPPGTLISGWQLHDRVVLRSWAEPPATRDRLERLFGPPEPVDEVFGTHTVSEMLGLRQRLLRAPRRVADAATHLLAVEDHDLAWLTFCSAHVAGHQFWDLSQLPEDELDDDSTHLLGTALEDIYDEVDAALGRVVAALPPDGDLMIVSPVGMDVNTSRADMLPGMLEAVLGKAPEAGSSSIWWLRASLPSGLRARVANVLPERAVLDLTARLELRGPVWSETRAFAHPADNQGYIRLNLQGRERDGIVHPDHADALLDEIAAGLMTFTDMDGSPAVDSIERVSERFGDGERSDLLPDLIVRWTATPATRLAGVRSERFGTVSRQGVGSGRSGNHTEDGAWALVVPGSSRAVEPSRTPRLEDVAATVAAIAGLDAVDLAGEPLLESTSST